MQTMKNFLSNSLLLLAIVAVAALVFVLGVAIIGAIALGLSALLRWVVPDFSLFEATLLSTLFGFLAAYGLRFVIRIFLPEELFTEEKQATWMEKSLNESFGYQNIPPEQFYQTRADRTWEAWLQFVLANDIYTEIQAAHEDGAKHDPAREQELATQLADAGLKIIKRKTGRARRLSITRKELQRELAHSNQRVEVDVQQMALAALNMNLNFYGEPLRDVIRNKRWQELASVPEMEEQSA